MKYKFRKFCTTSASMGLALALFTTGCGGDKKKAAPAAAQASVPQETEKVDKAPKKRIEIDNPIESTVEHAHRLMRDGKYDDALESINVLKAGPHMAEPPAEILELEEALRPLSELDKQISVLLPDVKNGDASAAGQIKNLGEPAFTLLRGKLHAETDPVLAGAIIDLLHQELDSDSAYAILRLWKETTDPDLGAKCMKALGDIVAEHGSTEDGLDTSFLMNLVLNVGNQFRPQRADELRSVIAKWPFSRISRDTYDDWARQISEDKDFDRLHIAEVLICAFEFGCDKDKSKFHGSFGAEPSPYGTMKAYVTKAASSSARGIRAWGRLCSPRMNMADFAKLEEKLAIYYNFDDISDDTYVRDPGNSSVRSKLMGSLAQDAIVSGKFGHCITFLGEPQPLQISKKSRISSLGDSRSKIMAEDYSFCAWVKPAELPKLAKDPISVIIGKSQMNGGLRVYGDGTVGMTHQLTGKKYVHARSKETISIGKWAHLAGTVDSKKGKVIIYLNGKQVGSASYSSKASIDAAYLTPNYLTAGWPGNIAKAKSKSDPGKIQWVNLYRFIGRMDEMRLYVRSLSADDVKGIYGLHAAID